MNRIPHGLGAESVAFALGGEEAAILLQPGEMFRKVLDANPSWAGACVFLTPRDSTGGMLAVLPRAAIAAWLGETSTHPVERDFQELLIQDAKPTELPKL
jgi:hypothetical protein